MRYSEFVCLRGYEMGGLLLLIVKQNLPLASCVCFNLKRTYAEIEKEDENDSQVTRKKKKCFIFSQCCDNLKRNWQSFFEKDTGNRCLFETKYLTFYDPWICSLFWWNTDRERSIRKERIEKEKKKREEKKGKKKGKKIKGKKEKSKEKNKHKRKKL